MARIPLVSEFKPQGIEKAIKEFKKLETTGQKLGFALEKAFVPATAALGALAAGGALAAKAAAEDAAQQDKLARQLRVTTDATDAQIAAVEQYIAETELAAAVSDSELRPAFENLVRATGDVTEAQELLGLALDISAATGKDLEGVSQALQEAYQGEVGPLKELDKSLTGMIASGADADEVMSQLAETFGGAAQENANTVTGRFERMQIQMANASEQIGYALLPIIEALLPKLEAMATWVGENTDLILAIGGAVATFAAGIVAANIAMKAWNIISGITAGINAVLATSFTALQVASGIILFTALVGVFILLQQKFDIFGKAVDLVTWYFEQWWKVASAALDVVIEGINLLIKAWNKIPFLDDIPEIEFRFSELGNAVEETGESAEAQVQPFQMFTDSIAESTIEAEISAAMLEQALIPAVEKVGVSFDTAKWELMAFYDQIDREDAFARFQDNLADVEDELAGLEPGSAEFEQNLRDAYNAVRDLSDTLGYIPATLEKTLLYRIEIGDIAGAERLAGLISAGDTYRATAQDELRFLGGASQSPSGVVQTININMAAGANGQDVIDAINRENRRTGAAQVQTAGNIRR